MELGNLAFERISEDTALAAEPVQQVVNGGGLSEVYISEIDTTLSDTVAFCDHYKIGLERAANCVVVEAKRADKVWYAACVILGTTRADINGVIRKYLEARKISFAPMDKAISMTAMEFGGITPIGLPANWPILVDTKVINTPYVIIGSGLRKSKLLVPGELLARLPNAVSMDITKTES